MIRRALLISTLNLAVMFFTGTMGLAQVQGSSLQGLWVSVQNFGPPDPGGSIVLKRIANTWSAQVGNETFSAQGADKEIQFAFLEGELRVKPRGADVLAQWIQPATAGTGERFALPVKLEAAAPNMWRGRVDALPDVEHFFLSITRQRDGSLQAFVRNPEGNLGAFMGTRTVKLDGKNLLLRRAGRPDVVARLDLKAKTIGLHLGQIPGELVFRKATATSAAAFYPRTSRIQYTYHAPKQIGDGWQAASLRSVGLDPKRIRDFITMVTSSQSQTLASPQIQSIQIARHGKLVLDEYFYGYDSSRPHDIRSAGKSLTTLLLGIAMESNPSITPRSRVYALFSQYAPFAHNDTRKRRITIEDLMTMSAGYACDDNDDASPGSEDRMQSQTAQPDWYKFTLDLPMTFDPGTSAAYCSAEINLLGGIISKATNTWLPFYFYDRLAAPLQFGAYAMPITPPPLTTAYMAGGAHLLPRDFLKFGQLFLDHGRWNGRQIIDDRWLEDCARPRAHSPSEGRYGYGWHLYSYNVKGRTYNALSAGGNGGQLLFALPQLDMAVVITGGNYYQYPIWRKTFTDLVPRYIIPAAELRAIEIGSEDLVHRGLMPR